METTNTLPLFNFSQEFGINPIELNLLGGSPIVSGDTPIQNVMHNLVAFNQAFGGQTPAPTNKPKFCSDKTGKVVDCNSPDAVPYNEREGVTNDPSKQDPKNLPPDNSGDWYQEDVWTDKDGNIVPPNTPGATNNPGIWKRGAGIGDTLQKSFGVDTNDWFKRIVLVVLALLLITVAVVSLR